MYILRWWNSDRRAPKSTADIYGFEHRIDGSGRRSCNAAQESGESPMNNEHGAQYLHPCPFDGH